MISTETTDDGHLLHRIGLCQTPKQNSALVINQIITLLVHCISRKQRSRYIFDAHFHFISQHHRDHECFHDSEKAEISLYKEKYRIVLSHHFGHHLLIYTRKNFKISKYKNLENHANEYMRSNTIKLFDTRKQSLYQLFRYQVPKSKIMRNPFNGLTRFS